MNKTLEALLGDLPTEMLMEIGSRIEEQSGTLEGVSLLSSFGNSREVISPDDMLNAITAELLTRITVDLVERDDHDGNAARIATMPDEMLTVMADTVTEYRSDESNPDEDGPGITAAIKRLSELLDAEIARRADSRKQTMEA